MRDVRDFRFMAPQRRARFKASEEADLARGQIVNRADDLDLALFDQSADHVAATQQLVDLHFDVGLDHAIDELDVGRAAIGAGRGLDRIDRRLDFVEQQRQVAELHAVASALDGTAGGVTHDHDQLGAGRRRGEFEAAEQVFIDDVARDPTDEQVAYALVEDDFRRRARIEAGQHHRERVLTVGGGLLLCEQVAIDGLPGDEPGVSFLEQLQRLIRRECLLGLLVERAVMVVGQHRRRCDQRRDCKRSEKLFEHP